MQFMPMPYIGGRILTNMKMNTLHLDCVSCMEEGLCDGTEAQEGFNYCSVFKWV